jgi:hypothetical protein
MGITTGGSGGITTRLDCVQHRNDLPPIHRPFLA